MSCVLRITGKELNVDEMLSASGLAANKTWRLGEVRSIRGKIHDDSGANFLASEADLDAYAMQVTEATNFLKAHHRAIKELVDFPGVDVAVLDFGVSIGEETFAKYCHLPRTLVALAAAAGLSIEVSYYKVSDTAEGP